MFSCLLLPSQRTSELQTSMSAALDVCKKMLHGSSWRSALRCVNTYLWDMLILPSCASIVRAELLATVSASPLQLQMKPYMCQSDLCSAGSY